MTLNDRIQWFSAFFKKIPTGDADPYAQEVIAKGIELLYRNTHSLVFGLSMTYVVTVIAMWNSIDRAILLTWFAVGVIATIAHFVVGRAYFRRLPTPQNAAQWGRYASFLGLASGLVWGSAGMLFFVPDSAALQVFLYTCIVSTATASIVTNSYWLESYYTFTIPALSLPALRLLAEGGFAYRGLAIMSFVLLAVIIEAAHRSRKSAYAAIRLRFEKLDLVERLSQEKDKAEAANRDKTRFLAAASHDLRQPVHALALFADALRGEMVSAKAKRLIGNIERSVDTLNQLLGSLLDISKLDANIVKPDTTHFSLRALFAHLDAEYALQARSKGLGWRMDVGDVVVRSDATLLETILHNLISNAIRYTHAGNIDVSCTRHGAEARIEVRDTGIGIPQEQHKEIFREFFQLANAERDRTKGLGLGLAIVDRLASLLRHRIELHSELGRGSRFVVVLPAGNPATMAAAMPAAHLSQHDVSRMRVAVIDDEAAVRDGMRAVLESWGCEAVLAGSEDEALNKMQNCAPPHAIVADYRLRDGKTGAQAIERLRRAFGNDIPALIITGDTDPAHLREAEASGHALMHKPVQPAKLRAYLRQAQPRGARAGEKFIAPGSLEVADPAPP